MVILQSITELSCHAAEIVKLLKTVKLDMLFKKEQRNYLPLKLHCKAGSATPRPLPDASLWLDSCYNLQVRTDGMPVLALAVLFRFQRASGPGHFHGNQKEAAHLPVSWATRWETTHLGDCWLLFWGFQSGKFPEEMKETAALCWPEGLTVMREILL